MRKLRLCSLLLALACAVGCGAPVQGLYKSPSFTKPNVLGSGMAVVGVERSSAPLPAGEVSLYSNILMGQVQNKWSKLSLTPADVVKGNLGPGAYQELMAAYAQSGVLSSQDLARLKNAVGGARYALFARIEQDLLNHDIRNTNNPPPSHYDQKTGKWVTEGQGSYVSTYTTTRTVGVSFAVYDLETAGLAWSGSISESVPTSNNYSTPYNTNDTGWQNLANGIVSGLVQGQRSYPSPATVQAVLENGFYDFAHKMFDK